MNTYIVSDPDILGGDPVIKGTRVPVERIKYLILQDFSIASIKNMYPHVPKKTLKAVIDEVFDKSIIKVKNARPSSQI